MDDMDDFWDRKVSKTAINSIINIKGTSVDNNKVTVNLHIHIHSNDGPTINKIGRIFNALIGQKHKAIENATSLSDQDLKRRIFRGDKNR